jgi:hypothetical protein
LQVQPSAALSAPGAAPAELTYLFKAGETHRYRVKAFFDGHFPPFAQPGSQPIHMLAEIVYVSSVSKQTASGTEVKFTVESADLSLLTREVKTDEQISPDDQTPFPIELEDIQKALNTTAILKPDGSITQIVNGNPNAVRINIGFDLRKLFLLTMPITFPQKPVQVGDTWAAKEGVLGSKPGSITYTNRLARISSGNGTLEYHIDHTGASKIDDVLDQQGNHTSKPADVFSTLKGDVTLEGNATFATPAKPTASGAGKIRSGRMVSGELDMTVNLRRKTTKADAPEEIRATTDGDYDVRARMLFRNDDAAQKEKQAMKSQDNGTTADRNGGAK